MKRRRLFAAIVVAGLLPAGPAVADLLETAACVSAHDWTVRMMQRAGLPDYLQGWRCDVVEDLGDGIWRIAGVYGRRDLRTIEPFVVRLFGPFLGHRFGYCEVIIDGYSLPFDGLPRQCRRVPDPPA